VVSAGQREPLGVSPSIAAVGVPPAPSAVSSLAGMPPAGLGSLGALGGFPTQGLASMADLEVQHLAAQRRHDRSILGMSAESRMEYMEEM